MVIMGRVVGAHGIRGWIKVQPYTEYMDTLLDYNVWWLGPEQGPWREVKVLQSELHTKGPAVLLDDCPDRNASERLKGQLIAVPRCSLPEEDDGEHYWSDLMGMSVVNEAGEVLGVVVNLLETGANDVLIVKGDSGKILVPFVDSAVKEVDVSSRIIRVDWSADYLS